MLILSLSADVSVITYQQILLKLNYFTMSSFEVPLLDMKKTGPQGYID